MDMLSLIDELDEEKVAPVYLLHGPESFFLYQLIQKIRAVTLNGPVGNLNSSRFRGSEITGEGIVDHARELPMMARRRFLHIEEADKLKAKDWEALDPYLANPLEQTVLVIVAESFSLRSGPLAKANRRGQVHKAESLKERDIARFVRWRARARDVNIGEDAIYALSSAVGPDAALLDDAVERLGLYVGPQALVTPHHVAELVTVGREYSIFELVDAIGNQNSTLALARLENLLKNREEPLKINAMIARHIRLLLKARIALHQGSTVHEFAERVGLPVFVAQKLHDQCRSFRGAALERYLVRMSRSDYELKSSRQSSRIIVEHAVLDLCLS